MTLFIKALQRIRPNALYQSYGDDYSKLVWVDNVQTKPTEAEIMAAVQQIQLELVSDPTVFEREAAKKTIDGELRFLIKSLIKELNRRRKYERDVRNAWNTASGATPAAFLADLKSKILAINQDGEPAEITFEQFKNLFDQEV